MSRAWTDTGAKRKQRIYSQNYNYEKNLDKAVKIRKKEDLDTDLQHCPWPSSIVIDPPGEFPPPSGLRLGRIPEKGSGDCDQVALKRC
jgi:hypothetical protein